MERIGKEVERTLWRTGGGDGLALSEITAAWAPTVGEAISRQAWPLRIGRDGTLHVATSSATWAFELDRMSLEIAGRLAAVLGERSPRKLRFRVGPVPEPGASAAENATVERRAASEATPEATPEVEAAAESAASAIDDEELRELVARAARASLSKGVSEGRSGRGFW